LPPPPPFSRPRELKVCQRFGPHSWGVAEVGNSPPLFVFGGTSPKPPGRGLRPLHPRFPTLVGLGFANALGPTLGGVAEVKGFPPFKVSWVDTPHSPSGGGFAPSTPGSRDTPQGPRLWALPPWPPFGEEVGASGKFHERAMFSEAMKASKSRKARSAYAMYRACFFFTLLSKGGSRPKFAFMG
jgi:hypothetical protein